MKQYGEYNHINTPELLEELDAYLMDGEKCRFDFLAFDTESNGTSFFKNVIIGFSISPTPTQGFYIPLLEWMPDQNSKKVKKIDKQEVEFFEHGWFKEVWTGKIYPEFVTPDQYRAPELVLYYLARWGLSTNLIMHNAPFDCTGTAYSTGIDLSKNLHTDTILVKHFLDENTPHGLKKVAQQWKAELGFDPEEDATSEQRELGASVLRNGGKFNGEDKHIWRGDPMLVSKYACKDTVLTFRLFLVGMEKFETELDQKQRDLFFEKEIMPLCREVVVPMRYGGMYIDVPFFETLLKEVTQLLEYYEDLAMAQLEGLLDDFPLGDSIDQAVSRQRFLKRLIELENLEPPYQINKKTGERKESLSKKALQDAYQREPHWLLGYMLGEEEMKYSQERVDEIRLQLYREILERRYRFNLNSVYHLRWLFFQKLGIDPKSVPGTDSSTKDNHIPKVDAETLEDLIYPKFPDLIHPILVYKKLEKLRSSYIEPALHLHNKGWLHLDMKQYGTISGRFSCSGGFNLQTLPKPEEVDGCPKCDSKNVSVERAGNLIAHLHCNDCKHGKLDIVCYSAIKRAFIAPPGYKIVNADYSSLEPRCFAFMSGDEKLKDIYRRDLDMYAKVYCDMHPDSPYSPDPKSPNFLKKKNNSLRNMFKPVVLGIPYGARDPQVANLMGLKKKITLRDGTEKEILDVEKGRYYRELYLSTYEDLRRFMEECELDAVTKGWVETLPGRRRRFQYAPSIFTLITGHGLTIDSFLDQKYRDLTVPNPGCGLRRDGLVEFSRYFDIPMWDLEKKGNWAYLQSLFKNELNNAKNFRIQGLAAHITNRAMLDATRLFVQNELDAYVCLQVHDEITCYVREDQAEFGRQILKQAMEQNEFAKIVDIPMIADPVICDNLRDSK
jgi:DNA polymerase I-like protein with 3'-5' exonuclease and polymerase domains